MKAGAIPVKNVWTKFVDASAVSQSGTIESGFRQGQEIAIANANGTLYALSNKLPPTGQPATLGKVEKLEGKDVIVEALSGSCFDLKTGKPVGPWCPSTVGRLLLRFLTQPTTWQPSPSARMATPSRSSSTST